MTLVILLLAVLALIATTGPAHSANAGQPQAEPAQTRAHEERHEGRDGLTPQPLLGRPGVRPGKPISAMTNRAHAPAKAWQASSRATSPTRQRAIGTTRAIQIQRRLMAIHARILSGVMLARAQTRAS
jgi:hypothetical protein